MDRRTTEFWGIEIQTVRGWETLDRMFRDRVQAESWLRMHAHEYRHPPRLVRFVREEVTLRGDTP